MDKNPHEGHRSRLREQARNSGLLNFQEHQALEMMLGYVIARKDTNVLAHDLINKFGSFAKVLEAPESELLKVKGVGVRTANFLATYLDFYNVYKNSNAKNQNRIVDLYTARNYVVPTLINKQNEEVHLICLDSRGKIVADKIISKGIANCANIEIAEITKTLFINNCTNFIIAHNHPKGKCVPSAEDNRFTKALATTACINGHLFIDHIIVSPEGIYSYKKHGNLDLLIRGAAEGHGIQDKWDAILLKYAKYAEE